LRDRAQKERQAGSQFDHLNHLEIRCIKLSANMIIQVQNMLLIIPSPKFGGYFHLLGTTGALVSLVAV